MADHPAPRQASLDDLTVQVRRDVVTFFDPPQWQSPLPQLRHSGHSLADTVRALAPRFVVDVGCGDNPFKGRIANLIGIDLVNPAADLICDLLDAPIRPRSIDVVLALGCINFGPRDLIEHQLRHVAGWLTETGRIIMRANPGRPPRPGLEFFPWSAENVDPIGASAGLHRDGPIRHDTHRTAAGDETCLVWHYRSGRAAAR